MFKVGDKVLMTGKCRYSMTDTMVELYKSGTVGKICNISDTSEFITAEFGYNDYNFASEDLVFAENKDDVSYLINIRMVS